MVFNITFNSTSVVSWRSVLLGEETGVPEENHRPIQQVLIIIHVFVTENCYYIMLHRVHRGMSRIRAHNVSGKRDHSITMDTCATLRLGQIQCDPN